MPPMRRSRTRVRPLRANGAFGVIGSIGRRVANYAVNRGADYVVDRGQSFVDNYFRGRSASRSITPSPRGRAPSRSVTRSRSPPRTPTQNMRNLRRNLQRTPRRVRMRRNVGGRGASSSKSSGFIFSNTPVKRGGASMVTRRGVSIVQERGGVLDAGANSATAGNVVAIGHNNVPVYLATQMLWRAVVKALWIKANNIERIANFEEQMGGGVIGSIVRIRYRYDPDDTVLQQDLPLASAQTLDSVALTLAALFVDTNASVVDKRDIEFYDIRFISSGAYADTTLNLRKAVFHFYSKSTLKVQNRTVQDLNDDEESVDNVPLHGKVYFGKGTGTSAFTRDPNTYVTAASGFFGDTQYGCIGKVPTEKWYQEPVPASHFINVSTTGKIHMDPGHIKTSVLDGRFSVSMQHFYKTVAAQMLLSGPSGLSALEYHKKTKYGNYRFMLIEKMINAVAGTPDNGIKLAWETNIRMGGYITTSNQTETAQLNTVAVIAPGGEA